MRPYSIDLRERVVTAVERGECTQSQAAEQFRVGLRTVERWLNLKRTTQGVAAKPPAGGAVRKLAGVSDHIVAEVKRQPDVTLAELCQRVEQVKGVKANASMMCRELQRLGLPRKKRPSMLPSATRHG